MTQALSLSETQISRGFFFVLHTFTPHTNRAAKENRAPTNKQKLARLHGYYLNLFDLLMIRQITAIMILYI